MLLSNLVSSLATSTYSCSLPPLLTLQSLDGTITTLVSIAYTLVMFFFFYVYVDKLQQVLPAGSYELRIVLPTQSMSSPSACIPYNLQLSLGIQLGLNMLVLFWMLLFFFLSCFLWLTSVATSGVSSAPACYGEHLPYSFNTMHYLGTDGQMNYQSDDWLVPSNFVFATLHDIRFYVNSTSIIRVYTEPHSTDIDIKLFNYNSADPVCSTFFKTAPFSYYFSRTISANLT